MTLVNRLSCPCDWCWSPARAWRSTDRPSTTQAPSDPRPRWSYGCRRTERRGSVEHWTPIRACATWPASEPIAEHGPVWALAEASAAAGHEEPTRVKQARVTSARRMSAAAVLQAAGAFDDVTMIAVVDAAARWLEEPEGDDYAYALLGAVTDHPTQLRVYGELLGSGGGA